MTMIQIKAELFFGILSLIIVASNAVLPSTNEKSWNYEIKSMESTTTDENLVKVQLGVDRVSRGIYAISGTFDINFDIVEGDNNEIEAGAFRSDNGVNDFKVLPFKMPRQHIFSCLNSFYKDMLMDTLKECSDMPAFEDEFEPPFEKKTYTFTKCQFSQEGFPNHLPDGFYKIVLSGYGSVEWSVVVIAQVESAH